MKPAVKSKKLATILALLVGGFALWWYLSPFWWLGVIMGLVAVSAVVIALFAVTRKK